MKGFTVQVPWPENKGQNLSHYMTALAMQQKGLKPASKIVLYWLADHHNGETGRCFPSLSTLARECEMSKAAVARHLSELEKLGLIVRHKRHRSNGSQTSSEYELSMKQPVSNIDSPCLKSGSPPVSKCSPHNLGNNNLGNKLYSAKRFGGMGSFEVAARFAREVTDDCF